MTVSAAQLRALAAIGIAGDQLLAVVEIMEMRDESHVTERDARRDGPMTSAERSRNYRARQRDAKRDERVVTQNVTEPPSPPSNGFPTPLPITTPSSPTFAFAREQPDDGWPPDAFGRFWNAYPHKVAKKSAQRAFAAAKRTGVTFERLMFALDRYKLEKPPDRAWCNPATWLNGGRWDDEPAAATGDMNGQRPHTPSRKSAGADFFAGLAEVAADIDRDGAMAGRADPDIPAGRFNIEH